MRHLTVGTKVIVNSVALHREARGTSFRILTGFVGTIVDRRRSRAGGIDRMVFRVEFGDDMPEDLKMFSQRWLEEWMLSDDIEAEQRKLKEIGYTKWTGHKYENGDKVMVLDGRGDDTPKVVAFTESMTSIIGHIGTIVNRFMSTRSGSYYRVQMDDGWQYHYTLMERWLTSVDYDNGLVSYFDEWG